MPTLSVEEFARGASPTITAAASAEYDYTEKRTFDDSDESIQQQIILLRTPLYYKKLSEQHTFALSLQYESSLLGSNNPFFKSDKLLHNIELPFTLIKFNDDSNWAWILSASPSIGTDFDATGSDAYGGYVLAVLGYRMSNTFAIGFGVYYSHQFDNDLLVPGLGFTWLPHKDWALGFVPPRASIFYTPSDNWRFGLQARLRGGSWLVNSDTYGDDTRLSYYSLHTYASIEYQLANSDLWLGARAGFTFGENWEAEQSNGFTAFDKNSDPALFIGLSLRYLGF